jgi:hypothetical protein
MINLKPLIEILQKRTCEKDMVGRLQTIMQV